MKFLTILSFVGIFLGVNLAEAFNCTQADQSPLTKVTQQKPSSGKSSPKKPTDR